MLLERGLIDAQQLSSGLAHQRQWGIRLGAALVAKGFIAEGMLTRVLSEFLGIPMVDLAKVPPDPRALKTVPARVCEQYDVFPIAVKEAKGRPVLLLAMADPLNATAIDEIAFTTGCVVKPAIAQISSLDQAVQRHYHGKNVEIRPLEMERVPLIVPSPLGAPAANTNAQPLNLDEEVSAPVVVGTVEQTAPPAFSASGSSPPAAAPGSSPPSSSVGTDAYAGLPTGTFSLPPVSAEGSPVDGEPAIATPLPLPSSPPAISRAVDIEQIEALENKFWALMRILSRRGLVTKEEFMDELKWTEQQVRT